MVETIPLSQRRVDIVLVAFFLINLLFVSYFIDTEQLVIANPAHFTYPIWPPRPVIDAVHWWGNNFDPLLIARPVFFKVTIWLDNLLYGPFYLIAIYAYIRRVGHLRRLANNEPLPSYVRSRGYAWGHSYTSIRSGLTRHG